MQEAGWEIASHGFKWVDYKDVPKRGRARAMREAIRIHTEVTGARPLGWYTGRALHELDRARDGGGRVPLFVGRLCRRPAVLGATGRTGRI